MSDSATRVTQITEPEPGRVLEETKNLTPWPEVAGRVMQIALTPAWLFVHCRQQA